MKQRIIYILLTFFLGMFGMNRFYVNQNRSGLIIFLSSLAGSILTPCFYNSYELTPLAYVGMMLLFLSALCTCVYLFSGMIMTDAEFDKKYNLDAEGLTKSKSSINTQAMKEEISTPAAPMHDSFNSDFNDEFAVGQKVIDSRGMEWEIINTKEKTIECKSSQGVCIFNKGSVKLK